MQSGKELILRSVEAKARRRTAYLATQLVRAAPAEKEEILAAFEFERWLAQACQDCRPTVERGPGDRF